LSSYKPEKLHVTFSPEMEGVKLPRCYTLTHSDRTGDLFLKIAPQYDLAQISDWYTRLMRDEVLGQWKDEDGLALHFHCHVSGGLVLGPAKWRYAIFKGHLPMALEAIINGDGDFLHRQTNFQNAPLLVHFHAKQASLNRVEEWGSVRDYLVNHNALADPFLKESTGS